jgi:hypothetical protein
MKISGVAARDVRFPTTRDRDGSDSMNQGDYSATYVVLRTDEPGLEGHGLTFTNGRGNELCVGRVRALERHVRGRAWKTSSATCARFSDPSPRMCSSAGSVPRRASCTWRRAR